MKKESSMQKLFAYAGNYKYLIIASWILSAVSALIALLPFYYIWRIMQEVVLAAPDYSKAQNLSGLGWRAVGFALLSMFIYICGLLCSHIAAFHVQANMRSTLMRHILTLPMGFMDSEGSGKIRKIVNESTAATETYLAHQLPDKAGAVATPVGLLLLLVVFDWKLGLLSLVPVVFAFLIMGAMTGHRMKIKMEEYQNALEEMSSEAVEYVRGIPVVKTFGQFVIRGNAVIGFIIFLIIVLVQFIVITKGSERVAEVAARFTLDAMPGKQMAIDADLNSGLIDEQQARERRSKIQREADFFGSMDGATKFVKGDAIISIIITFINFVGGLIVGIMNSQGSIQDIMQIYTTSTIGDGLVSQIPALLISVATGMVVTRSASENSLSEDLTKQFLAQPRVLMTAGGAAACLCLIPGFPVLQILIISAGMVGGGYYLYRHQKSLVEETAEELVETEVTSEASYYKNIENVYGLLNVEQIEMEFGYSLIPLADEGNGGNFIDRVVMFRKQMALDMGFVIPSVRIKDSGQLNPNQYSILLKGEEVARGDILMDHYLALPPGTDADDVPGIDTIDPAFHIPAKWISGDRKIQAELAGYTLIDPTSVVITHLSEVVKEHLHELLNRQEVNNLLEALKKTNSSIVRRLYRWEAFRRSWPIFCVRRFPFGIWRPL